MKLLSIDALPLLSAGGISHYVRPLVERVEVSLPTGLEMELVMRLWSAARRRAWHEFNRSRCRPAAAQRVITAPDRLIKVLWERGAFVWRDSPGMEQVFLSTTDLVPDTRGKPGRHTAWIVYDVIPARIPQFFGNDPETYCANWRRRAQRADRIIAISESTRRDIIEEMGYPPERISVVYPGATRPHPEPPPYAGFDAVRRPYVLYLGALAPNKNVDGLLRIFARCVHERGLDMDIVLTGRDFCEVGFWQGMARELRIADRAHFTGWITDAEREHLLLNARMLWQFSWYEGFGLPVLEAASRGIPVLCSNRGAPREILCNPRQEIDPADEDAAVAAASTACASDEILGQWRQSGLERAKLFDWDKSATMLLNCLNSICF